MIDAKRVSANPHAILIVLGIGLAALIGASIPLAISWWSHGERQKEARMFLYSDAYSMVATATSGFVSRLKGGGTEEELRTAMLAYGDPWGNLLVLDFDAKRCEFSLSCMGEDGVLGTDDDVCFAGSW